MLATKMMQCEVRDKVEVIQQKRIEEKVYSKEKKKKR